MKAHDSFAVTGPISDYLKYRPGPSLLHRTYCYTVFSFQKKKNSPDWIALHEERHFDCLRKLVDAINYNSAKHFRGWVFDEEGSVNLQLYYLVIVVQGGLLDARQSKTGVRLHDSKHIVFKQNAIVDGEECNYLIDVIRESFFEKYLGLVENEAKKIVRQMQRRKAQIRKSIDEIALRGKNARNDEEIKKIMEL